ncbi:MAG: zinc-ribbon domain-containing protein [Treponema sp.]|jgi:RNA polymerase subunit RPABC4/transcription elongation factor Spt4|nr:zinc-ribbon domain-containing protein [Treponema sp.]
MHFCSNCGRNIEDGVKFCPSCGTPIGSAAVEIKQEKAVNFIQTMPSASAPPDLYNNQNTHMAHVLAVDERYCFSCGTPIKKAAEICMKCGVNQNSRNITSSNEIFCASCGKLIKKEASICPFCGVMQASVASMAQQQSSIVQQQPVMAQPQSITADEKFCFSCGSLIKKAAEVCPKCGVNQNSRNSITAIDIYCISCGKNIKKDAPTCPFCGVRQKEDGISIKNRTTAIMCWFFGVHRFYVGKIGTGILYLITLGGMLIWSIIDLVYLCTNKFTDAQGNLLKKI